MRNKSKLKGKTIRILHVISSLASRHGGPPKACVEMAQAMVTRGQEVDIFTTNEDGPRHRLQVPTDRPVEIGGVNVHYFHAEILRGWPCVSIALWRAVKGRIRDYDIAHIHGRYLFPGMVSGYYCRKYGVPYLIRPHGTLDPFLYKRHRYRKALLERLFERRNLRHAAGVHFTADEEMRLAKQVVNFDNGVVVPLGLNLGEFRCLPSTGTFRQAFPEVGRKKIVLFLSRINFKKGLDLLIPAFARLAQQRDDVHLVLAGPDNEGFAQKVRNWVRAEGIEEATTFTGLLKGEMKLAAFRDAEMFVLPSYSENFGIAVVEAMACGLPVLVSNKVNIWREIKEANAGLVGDCAVEPFANFMTELLENPGRAAEMGRNGSELVKDRYAWPRAAQMLEEAYQSLLTDWAP